MNVRTREPADQKQVEEFLARHGTARVARLGELVDALDHPALLAEEDGRLVGVLTLVAGAERCEILTLHVDQQWRGAGTALLEEAGRIAAARGCSSLFLITTNDNVDALRFYQRRGFQLVALHPGAVDDSRTRLKSDIPEIGNHGIPVRDELELEKVL